MLRLGSIPLWPALAFACSSLIACADPACRCSSVAPISATPQVDAPTPDASDTEPSFGVHVIASLTPEPHVDVSIAVHGPSEPDEQLRAWSLAGPVVALTSLEAHDVAGTLTAIIEPNDHDGLHLSFDRAPTPPLSLSYTLTPTPESPTGLPRLELDDAHLFATGEALLLLPDDALDRRQTLKLSIDAQALAPPETDGPTGLPQLRSATSFSTDPVAEVDGWPFELRRAAFVAGSLEWAQLDSMHGQDHWLGMGPSRFDHRWSAAELAGVREAIDSTIGLPTLEPFVTILLSTSRSAGEPPIGAELRGRGLVIAADHNAAWDAQARMTTAQALAARWLGGRVRVLEAPGLEHGDERALWFELGVTRFVAREVLYELGLLSDEDYAAELDRIELELASSPLRASSLTELAAAAAASTDDPTDDPTGALAAADARSLLVARGAMYMAWMDAELRAQKSAWRTDGALEILRLLVANAVVDERRELSVAELVHHAAMKLSPGEPPDAALMAGFERIVVGGERPKLVADAFGPCFRPRARKLRRFELGFVDTTRMSDERPSFAALDPGGPAAKAGLRSDDRLVSLDYVPGDAEAGVRIEVERGAVIRYQPAGPMHKVVQWERVPNVPPEACVR